jgi:hypothetical protein
VLLIRARRLARTRGRSPVVGGVNPVSIAVSRDLVYVANQGNPGATNYTGFTLDSGAS